MTNQEKEVLGALVTKTAQNLGEHFSAVVILVSYHDSDGTSCFSRGTGDWFARQGLAHDYIIQEVAEATGKGVAREMNKQ